MLRTASAFAMLKIGPVCIVLQQAGRRKSYCFRHFQLAIIINGSMKDSVLCKHTIKLLAIKFTVLKILDVFIDHQGRS